MTGRYSIFLRPIILLGDQIALNLAFFIAFWLKIGPETDYHIPGPYIWLLLYLNVQWLVLSLLLENYDLSRLITYRRSARQILQSILLHFFSLTVILVFIKTTYFSRVHIVLNYSLFSFYIILWRSSLIYLLRIYRKKGYNYRTYVVAGYGDLSNILVNFLNRHPEYGYHFKGFFDNSVKGKDIVGELSEIEKYALESEIDEVYCLLPSLDNFFVKKLTQFADNNLIRVKLIPGFHESIENGLKVESYGEIPIILNRKEPLEKSFNQNIKRAFDIVFSLLVILGVLSWLVPLISLLIKITSPGPIFFLQKRSGKNGKVFWCYKFRTMRVQKQGQDQQACRNDKRITGLGKILRRTNLDELPQFFNVLFGEMSVVGPRPHMLEHTRHYSHLVDKYMVRHLIKPGITGLAQVKGFRGETKDIRLMINRIRMDIFYVEHWNFLLDLKIILLTVIKMIKGDKNAF